MDKKPYVPAAKHMAESQESSERTISDEIMGITYHDQEAHSHMVLPGGDQKYTTSDSERTLSDNNIGQTRGHAIIADDFEVNSVSHPERIIDVESNSVNMELPQGYREISMPKCLKNHPFIGNLGEWKATEKTRTSGKPDKYYFHKDFDYPFRSMPEITEFLQTGTVRGRIILSKGSDYATKCSRDRRTTKRRRMTTATPSKPSGPSSSTTERMASTSNKLPHGFV